MINGGVSTLADNLRAQLRKLGINNAEGARRCGMSPQRFSNYLTGFRRPDPELLAKIADRLETTVDALLGGTDQVAATLRPILVRLCELEGMSEAKATFFADVAIEALRLSRSAQDEGDALTRSRLAAQFAWQSAGSRLPN